MASHLFGAMSLPDLEMACSILSQDEESDGCDVESEKKKEKEKK